MPIYEYDCPVCGCIEVIQKIDEAPLQKCPYCSKAGRQSAVSKKISLSTFHLKGSGWYATDYNGKNGSNGSAGHKTESAKDSSKESKPAETKTSSPAKESSSPSSAA